MTADQAASHPCSMDSHPPSSRMPPPNRRWQAEPGQADQAVQLTKLASWPTTPPPTHWHSRQGHRQGHRREASCRRQWASVLVVVVALAAWAGHEHHQLRGAWGRGHQLCGCATGHGQHKVAGQADRHAHLVALACRTCNALAKLTEQQNKLCFLSQNGDGCDCRLPVVIASPERPQK